jgi:hypothetical protein
MGETFASTAGVRPPLVGFASGPGPGGTDEGCAVKVLARVSMDKYNHFYSSNTGIAAPRNVCASYQCGMDDSPQSGEEMGRGDRKGGKSYWGVNGIIKME